jgi:hypothetical protein
MTEAEWLSCLDPHPMLEFIEPRVSQSVFRLFAVGCCRRIWPLMIDPRSQNAVIAAEQVAYRHRSWRILEPIGREATRTGGGYAAGAAVSVTHEAFRAGRVAALAASAAAARDSAKDGFRADPWALAEQAERHGQAELLREIIGNPFSADNGERFPPVARSLAEALAAGEPAHFAMHDALLEAGHYLLAVHFREPDHHPQGCLALDFILGKS